ncbi:hypothetical protein FACS1894189_6880 [Planctomycetales bacterium]|nr:hypothetical protein FACS1894189_6880 [Planctomycetales bacterium]
MYKQIIHSIQALRRLTELQQCPVLGAAGVRAFCYPHQLYVVRSVLESTQIRHLLADEVGLGKTLESLMIMNALRIRNGGKLRVSIVVGSEERTKQWRDEIFGRFSFSFWKNDVTEKYPDLRCNGNVFFVDDKIDNPQLEEFPNDGFRIIEPQHFDENKKYLEAEHCDLLILDELHSFSETLLNFITSRSEEYQSVLVLSATPLLGDDKDRLRLLKLLVPEYADWFELNGKRPNIESVPVLQAQMLRSRRLDFPKALPQRKPKIIKTEPLENDRERFRKARNLMQTMVRENLVAAENAILFVRRAAIGGQTLIDRLDEYRRQFPQYVNELTEIRVLCSSERGDTRFDALIDFLLDFFSEDDGSRKVIIAAQDNPTIDYLAKQIKRCLPDTGLLEFRQERTQTAVNSQYEEINKVKGIIEQFWSGDKQILIAHNDARESFNLQIADALVFYSLPWNPVDMEQWLGRVSRLGLRKKKTVEIVAIVQRDLIDEQIADLYQSLNIFEKPLDIEKNQDILNDITKQIRQTVLYGNNQISRPKLESDDWNETLMRIVPKNESFKLDDNVQNTMAEPVIKLQDKQTDFPKEDALASWLKILQQHGFIDIRIYKDDNYRYRPNPRYYDFKVILKAKSSSNVIPVLDREPLSEIPYIVKRSKIQLPPRDLVPITKGKKEHNNQQRYEVPLQFFNFGSPLHDDLVKTFTSVFNLPKLYQFTIQFNTEQFDEDSEVESGQYLIGILTTERKRFDHKSLLGGLPKSENKTQDEMRQSEQRRLETGLQADDRFLDLLFPGSLEIHGYKRIDEKWNEVKPEQLYDFLTHLPNVKNQDRKKIPSNVLNNLTRLAHKATIDRWQQNFQPLLEERIAALRQELQIREDVLGLKIEEQQRKIDGEANEQTIRLNYEPVKKRLEEMLVIVHKHFEVRQQYLTDSIEAANFPQCVCKAVLRLNVQLINTK